MTKRPPNDGQPPDNGDPAAYKVGHRCPPKERQFQKGQSGNPGGRRKATLDYAAILQAVLEQPVDLKGGAQITALEALLRVLLKSGLGGNRRAIVDLLDRLERSERRRAAPRDDADITAGDRAILERALRRLSGKPLDDDGSSDDSADDANNGDEADDD